MPAREELERLLARVEKATGPDRDLDKSIGLALVGFDPDDLPTVWPDIGSPPGWPAYTASIDAAVALVERVLPRSIDGTTGYGWSVEHDGSASVYRIESPNEEDEWSVLHRSGKPPLAILSALLRALADERKG